MQIAIKYYFKLSFFHKIDLYKINKIKNMQKNYLLIHHSLIKNKTKAKKLSA
jgi:hypothetical protein